MIRILWILIVSYLHKPAQSIFSLLATIAWSFLLLSMRRPNFVATFWLMKLCVLLPSINITSSLFFNSPTTLIVCKWLVAAIAWKDIFGTNSIGPLVRWVLRLVIPWFLLSWRVVVFCIDAPVWIFHHSNNKGISRFFLEPLNSRYNESRVPIWVELEERLAHQWQG